MKTQIGSVETQDAELQERVSLVIEDNARPADQIINEQTAQRDENENQSTPRFVP